MVAESGMAGKRGVSDHQSAVHTVLVISSKDTNSTWPAAARWRSGLVKPARLNLRYLCV